MTRLSDDEISAALGGLTGWEREGDEIWKEFGFGSFMDAIGFINRLAERADAADHHPELRNVYNRVRVAWSTHSEGGITKKDIEMARQAEEVSGE